MFRKWRSLFTGSPSDGFPERVPHAYDSGFANSQAFDAELVKIQKRLCVLDRQLDDFMAASARSDAVIESLQNMISVLTDEVKDLTTQLAAARRELVKRKEIDTHSGNVP